MRMVFSSIRDGGGLNLYVRAADGSGRAERLTESPNTHVATSMTPDGRSVVFHEITQADARDIRVLTLPRPGEATRSEGLIATQSDERNGMVAPDGRWLAYESNRSGQFEIYVRPFPNVDEREWLVSTNGGRQPTWTRNGAELFYVGLDGSLMTVSVEARGLVWSAGVPKRLFDNRYFSGGGVPRQYDVTPDGQRVLVLKPVTDPIQSRRILVIQNWVQELRRLVR
jgi:Tol biopolymer transport system component